MKLMMEWRFIPWRKLERRVFKLQTRIFKASRRGDMKAVRRLQKTLMRSWSGKCLAVRRVSQDNQGKQTAGVDGIKSLTPDQRLALVNQLRLSRRAKPTRRVWIAKPGGEGEKRPLGIPTIADRALQALVKLALEPEWEARFEPNSYGFRPGRGCHDAIEAIYNGIFLKAKYVLDADISQCFDRINQEALLAKINTFPTLHRQLKAWLKSGVMDQGQWFATSAGTPQGGVVSPLLANIALHGMEERIKQAFPRWDSQRGGHCQVPHLIRYADDLVVLHADLTIVQQCQQMLSEWLTQMGLTLHPSKTRITHTLHPHEGNLGFDFLGFTVRQFPAGKYRTAHDAYGTPLGFKTLIQPSATSIKRHQGKLKQIIERHQAATQSQLIAALNPVIIGWSNYFSTVVSSQAYQRLDHWLYLQLKDWATHRHPRKSQRWIANKYWHIDRGEGWTFATVSPDGIQRLAVHNHTAIKRHIKVQSTRSPFDADWLYWSIRMGRHPQVNGRVALLLKRQKGSCPLCRLFFKDRDLLEIDHIIPRLKGGKDELNNFQLLHRHCHDVKSANDGR
ncbi:group II intron reverse transcriptase/maturase [Leptolyngbya sp. NK1-12]|uniref:Group II intron reverse transcriptase/maturase n=1 Tax=Leptolyngbya sp. NK1-12 TaxID=2547451 RepID=A0AA96WBV3_9CYAN|nr:group II intron reverse transcriptase/maturase [Leptolyngbya sp. NK1-12]WNZ23119.1 group II intron reverse transcriptase/maturase [Leptolyngbya sp. NK1-12]WNZ23482.1 group II intron reverse transcriptase/maturase [Leptolyngbya sp. NK1-12]WNZ23709.1 group II intron reverse transcriptase/maturase [Leptolyngbya sp. NK1-12]